MTDTARKRMCKRLNSELTKNYDILGYGKAPNRGDNESREKYATRLIKDITTCLKTPKKVISDFPSEVAPGDYDLYARLVELTEALNIKYDRLPWDPTYMKTSPLLEDIVLHAKYVRFNREALARETIEQARGNKSDLPSWPKNRIAKYLQQ